MAVDFFCLCFLLFWFFAVVGFAGFGGFGVFWGGWAGWDLFVFWFCFFFKLRHFAMS